MVSAATDRQVREVGAAPVRKVDLHEASKYTCDRRHHARAIYFDLGGQAHRVVAERAESFDETGLLLRTGLNNHVLGSLIAVIIAIAHDEPSAPNMPLPR